MTILYDTITFILSLAWLFGKHFLVNSFIALLFFLIITLLGRPEISPASHLFNHKGHKGGTKATKLKPGAQSLNLHVRAGAGASPESVIISIFSVR